MGGDDYHSNLLYIAVHPVDIPFRLRDKSVCILLSWGVRDSIYGFRISGGEIYDAGPDEFNHLSVLSIAIGTA